MLKYIKPCNNEFKRTAENIAQLLETKCEYQAWDMTKEDIKGHWRTLMGFTKGEFADYHSYLLMVYKNKFNNKDKVSFQEFFRYITH